MFTPTEETILEMAEEYPTMLPEFGNSIHWNPGTVIDDRAEMGAAIVSLVERGFVSVGVSSREGQEDPFVRPVAVEELAARLGDGTAWDPAHQELIGMNATDAGRAALKEMWNSRVTDK